MTSQLENLLLKSGWLPQRQVEEQQVLAWIEEAHVHLGCRVFPEAVRVLTQYGGLTIGAHLAESAIRVGPFAAQFYDDPQGWLWWEWRIERVLFPIASLVFDDVCFAVASTGEIYGIGFGDWLCGEHFEDALETLCFHTGRIVDFTEKVITPAAVKRQNQSSTIYSFLQSLKN